MRLSNSNEHISAALMSIGSIGDFLHEYLDTRNTVSVSGEVHSVFKRCAYLQFDQLLLCAALPELGASSITLGFNSTVSSLPACLVRGAKLSLSLNGLQVVGGKYFPANNAAIYNSFIKPRTINSELMLSLHEQVIKLDLPVEGLASLLVTERDQTHNESALIEFTKPAIASLLSSLPELCSCTGHATRVLACANAKPWVRLLGAGPGLTPSGDDFLSGVLCALYSLGQDDSAQVLWDSVSDNANKSTNEISVALLNQAAAGRCSEKVSILIEVLFGYGPSTPDNLSTLLAQLGQTSGWDWLAGFVLSLNALLECNESKDYGAQRVEFGFSNSDSSSVRVH